MTDTIETIIKRTGEVVPYDRSKITDAIYKAAYACGGHDRQRSEELAVQVEQALNAAYETNSPPSVEEINDLVEKVLIENGHARTSKAFILYRAERNQARARQQQDAPQQNSQSIPYRMLYAVLNWNILHRCDSIEKINEHLRDGSYPDLVRQVDQAFEDDLRTAADQIAARKDEVRLVIIAGPSSSGKTTTTAKLAEYLRRDGLELVAMGLDNYYYDLEVHPKDEFGDYDFEGPEALDLPLVNEHLTALVAGEEIRMPVFDFPSGVRLQKTTPMKVEPHQLILIDSLHGLYGPMTGALPDAQKFKLYIETLSQVRGPDERYVRWTDIRMLRRMSRDKVHRNYNPERTVGHWHYVRRSELKHIIPSINEVDFRLNSALPYELPALRKVLFHYLPEICERYANEPKKTDAYIRAKRVHELLESVDELGDFDCIPRDSLLREFIGGGIYGQ